MNKWLRQRKITPTKSSAFIQFIVTFCIVFKPLDELSYNGVTIKSDIFIDHITILQISKTVP